MDNGRWGRFIKPDLKKLSVFVLFTLICIYEIRSTMYSIFDLPFVIVSLPILFVSLSILNLKIPGSLLLASLLTSLYLYLFSCLIVQPFEHFHDAQKRNSMLKVLLGAAVLLLVIAFLWLFGVI